MLSHALSCADWAGCIYMRDTCILLRRAFVQLTDQNHATIVAHAPEVHGAGKSPRKIRHVEGFLIDPGMLPCHAGMIREPSPCIRGHCQDAGLANEASRIVAMPRRAGGRVVA